MKKFSIALVVHIHVAILANTGLNNFLKKIQNV